ncbi:hypothetical protein [Paenibacillus pini]|uniref:Uncharacterized protein n=1 Tax=Paenibacillus pini JCM 16418 TaxID=1236976 RepID=W7YWD9_9BACL|nr:hypothetical protein [Paenibacillus pini]GAF06639.1 hypothetical protein JCM16418_611 [Paenibacillus pini JCM 16418]
MKKSVRLNAAVVVVTLAALLMSTQGATIVEAATLQLSEAQKFALTKATASDPSRAARFNSLYNELLQLQTQIEQTDQSFNTLHYRNEESLTTVRKQVQQINAAQLLKLASAVKQTQERYKPLFVMYTSLGNQLSVARKLKNKQLTSLLSTQLEAAKITVQLAREDIRSKQNALSTTRSKTTQLQKSIRSELSSIHTLKIHIKAEKSNVSTLNKGLSPLWKNVTQSIKINDAAAAYNALSQVTSKLRQMESGKQKIITIERKIETIIQSAKSKTPAV